MKRIMALALALATLTLLPGCAGTHRPEGVVERWLVSLNQGAAGEPSRYADDQATAEIASDWDTREPGAYDEIEVGTAVLQGTSAAVPFRVTTTDGATFGGLATVGTRSTQHGDEQVVFQVESREPPPVIAGTWSASAASGMWVVAVVAALFFAGLSIGVVSAVRPRRYG